MICAFSRSRQTATDQHNLKGERLCPPLHLRGHPACVRPVIELHGGQVVASGWVKRHPNVSSTAKGNAVQSAIDNRQSSIFMSNPTPATLGYQMPPEWWQHRGTWLSWPHRESSWPGKFQPVPHVFAEMVRLLSPHEEVHINVTGQEMEDAVRAILVEHGIAPSAIGRAASAEPSSVVVSTTTPPTTPGAATTAPASSSAT